MRWSAVCLLAVPLLAALAVCRADTPVCTDSVFAADTRWMDDAAVRWDECRREGGVHVVSRGRPLADFLLFKATAAFPAAALAGLRDLLWDHNVERNGEWSHSFLNGTYVARLGADADLVYMQYSGAWPVASRDFCYVRCRRELPGGGLMMVFRSVDDARCPPVPPGFVRGAMIDCAERIAVRSDGVEVTYVLQSDTGGWLPRAVSNAANVGVMCKEFAGLHRLVGGAAAP